MAARKRWKARTRPGAVAIDFGCNSNRRRILVVPEFVSRDWRLRHIHGTTEYNWLHQSTVSDTNTLHCDSFSTQPTIGNKHVSAPTPHRRSLSDPDVHGVGGNFGNRPQPFQDGSTPVRTRTRREGTVAHDPVEDISARWTTHGKPPQSTDLHLGNGRPSARVYVKQRRARP